MASSLAVASTFAPSFLASSPSPPDSRLLAAHGGFALSPPRLSSRSMPLPPARTRVVMSAAPKQENGMAGAMAVALLAAAVIPEIAEAAQPGVSPSLKNLLLSVVSGGVVLIALGGAVAAVSTFDPVKRK